MSDHSTQLQTLIENIKNLKDALVVPSEIDNTLLEELNILLFYVVKFIKTHNDTHAVVDKSTLRGYMKYYYGDYDHLKEVNRLNSIRYRKENPEAWSAINRDNARRYYLANKARIAEKNMQPMLCTCGATIQRSSRSRHIQSARHRAANPTTHQ